jgi:hypothetical protein
MCMEQTFILLKGCWRILMKRMDVALTLVPNIVCACLILHKLCILHGNNFDAEWINEF